ncbi:uncharacterized protein C1orf131 homolog isoform X3 [Thunnus albacares]|uniref:uncharacterized protein C1orf131 homolog isoform X3 n=1 Tax=Thunnus albacares TaxID=8236 RepID=UPI001CF691E1|nr:uncharacterized protein C1orf131 homolog isoform X3 [Thunnus albacares]
MNSKANGEEDEDCLFLEQVLDKLYDFDGAGNKPATKKKSRKKGKRKRCEEEEEEDAPSADNEDNRAEHFGVAHQQQQSKADTTTPQQTGPTMQQVSQVEVVTFQDPTKKQKTKPTPAPDKIPPLQIKEKKQSDQIEELNLEKARLEVHRFGITGYKKEQQRVFEQDRAVMLGARPPKKEYCNYKVLQQQIKEKKQKAKEEVQPDLKKKKKQNNQSRDKKKNASSGSSSAPSGQVGRFKNGMLILSSKEIQKIKGKRGSK